MKPKSTMEVLRWPPPPPPPPLKLVRPKREASRPRRPDPLPGLITDKREKWYKRFYDCPESLVTKGEIGKLGAQKGGAQAITALIVIGLHAQSVRWNRVERRAERQGREPVRSHQYTGKSVILPYALTDRHLARWLSCNKGTANDAVNLLVECGYVRRRFQHGQWRLEVMPHCLKQRDSEPCVRMYGRFIYGGALTLLEPDMRVLYLVTQARNVRNPKTYRVGIIERYVKEHGHEPSDEYVEVELRKSIRSKATQSLRDWCDDTGLSAYRVRKALRKLSMPVHDDAPPALVATRRTKAGKLRLLAHPNPVAGLLRSWPIKLLNSQTRVKRKRRKLWP